MNRPLTLPDGFLWGASTAAHQTEGGNTNSDWWGFEHSGLTQIISEPSGDTCDSYHRWREDMDLLAGLGFTDYRFSVEWARIEPAPGEFSRAALDHYRRMVEGAHERGLRPMVTLHHFTSPLWFAHRGGWTADGAVELFVRYAEAVVRALGDGVDHFCTINEPNMLATMVTVRNALTSGSLGSDAGAVQVGMPLPDEATTEALIRAHRAVADAVKAIAPRLKTGWSVASYVCHPLPGAESVADAFRRPREDVFLEAARTDDWLGVQAYSRHLIGPDGLLPVSDDVERTLTGWEFYPAALGEALRQAAAAIPGVPLIVTENGIATDDDSRRIAYTTEALAGMAEAMADGVDVRGYFHWTALDNYEWGSFAPTFGLIAVDRETFARTPKRSAAWLGAIGHDRVLHAAL